VAGKNPNIFIISRVLSFGLKGANQDYTMENFDDYGKKSYQAADRDKYKRSDFVVFYIRLFMMSFRVRFMAMKEEIVRLFSPQRLKDISGQLALVTGECSALCY
jgi:hypothetical protein